MLGTRRKDARVRTLRNGAMQQRTETPYTCIIQCIIQGSLYITEYRCYTAYNTRVHPEHPNIHPVYQVIYTLYIAKRFRAHARIACT